MYTKNQKSYDTRVMVDMKIHAQRQTKDLQNLSWASVFRETLSSDTALDIEPYCIFVVIL